MAKGSADSLVRARGRLSYLETVVPKDAVWEYDHKKSTQLTLSYLKALKGEIRERVEKKFESEEPPIWFVEKRLQGIINAEDGRQFALWNYDRSSRVATETEKLTTESVSVTSLSKLVDYYSQP